MRRDADPDISRAMRTQIAEAMRVRRVAFGLTQAALADHAGLPLGSVKRFEQTSAIALASLLEIVRCLDCLDGFAALFPRSRCPSRRRRCPRRHRGRGVHHARR